MLPWFDVNKDRNYLVHQLFRKIAFTISKLIPDIRSDDQSIGKSVSNFFDVFQFKFPYTGTEINVYVSICIDLFSAYFVTKKPPHKHLNPQKSTAFV
ncbi:hypothetical protein RO3G_10367 [Rhizopus delemar RA 99-880]|uniref:Uncharacterized protein n=1 Tax=Rhizopus delemar (strain RA 99-880 / ATCC MYA-4621 / FGSC 9543 / NRRL 43880) TaxID=246409 RepID=I1CB27_RHIO9|nr:hypothetical protein RO3G_10367 [Rhizopus delemar RA 99-880]|eukprot:EIE85657.1 hypothetical protein RO3G_10367 [Rhizopus delemar RA 99-880]